MLTVITPTDKNGKFTKPFSTNESIFLAGPCPRSDYSNDWRNDAIKYLESLGFNGIVYNPTNPNYDVNDASYLYKQTKWEIDAMKCSTKIVFWIPRSEKNPAFTTNIELGEWINSDKSVIGMPKDGIKNEYIKARLFLIDKPHYDTLEELLDATISYWR